MNEHRTRLVIIGAGIVALSVLIAIATGILDLSRALHPPPPAPLAPARLSVDVFTSEVDVMEEQEPHGMRVHDLTNSNYVPVELLLVVTNTGEAAAKNVNIDFIPAPEDTNWLDYHSKEFVEGDLQDASQDSADRSYQAALNEGSKIRINYNISISPSLYLQSKTSNPSITFFVTYDDHKEEINQYRVCFDDCLERLGWVPR